MIIHTVTVKKPAAHVPWLEAPPEARAVIKKYIDSGKILHQEISIIDELTAKNTFIFADQAAFDEFKSDPDPAYLEFSKYHNEVHCVTHGIEITRTTEEI